MVYNISKIIKNIMLKYSPDAFRKIKAVCEVIQERVELENSLSLEIGYHQIWVAKGLNETDFRRVFELLISQEKVVELVEAEKQRGFERGDRVVAYKIKVLPKFNLFIRDELRILPISAEMVKKIKHLEYLIDSTSFSVNHGEIYIEVLEGNDRSRSKSAMVLEHLWGFREMKKNGRITRVGDSTSEGNLIKYAGCKSADALNKLIQRLNRFMKDHCLPIQIISEEEGYQLTINFT